MQRSSLIARLNWFYSLELQQVALYTAQAGAVEDIYIARALSRVASIEQQHVDNIAAEIKRLGGKPVSLGDVIAPVTGKIAGTFTGAMGLRLLLKANIALEEKAMRDYKEMILKAGHDPGLFSVLWNNLIDEDLHTAWFAGRLKSLEAHQR